MAENNKDRCPKEFLDKDWIYVNTITAKGGDPALFLKYCEMKKSATPEQLKTGIYGSVHRIVVEAKAGNVEIDVYRSWRSDNSSLAFQTQYGLVLTKLLQTGFLPEKMELSQNQEIVEKGERKNLKDKLTF